MVNLVKEAQESKKKLVLSAMVAGLTIIAAVPLFILSGMCQLEELQLPVSLIQKQEPMSVPNVIKDLFQI